MTAEERVAEFHRCVAAGHRQRRGAWWLSVALFCVGALGCALALAEAALGP